VDRRLVFAGAAALALITVAGGIFASGILNQGTRSATPKKGTAKVAAKGSSPTETPEPEPPVNEGAVSKGAAEVPAGDSIAVVTPDGTVIPEQNFEDAMRRAIGARGHVRLNNREPLKFAGKKAIIPLISGGPLYIRAEKGTHPVLEVEINGAEPFLTLGTDTSLELIGVTILAKYTGPAQGPDRPPVIQAGLDATLERCAFTAVGNVQGSRAVAVEGGTVTVTGCWFEGFDKALDLAAFNKPMLIRQCMMVRAKTDDQPIGWGVKVRNMPGLHDKKRRRLTLDHCTVKGKGFVDLAEFSALSPMVVDVKSCAVLADALLAWETPPPGSPFDEKAVAWTGEGNQYDLRGKSWVVLSSRENGKELPGGPTDLVSWTKIGKETGTLLPPVKLHTDPSALSESPTPADFAVEEQSTGAAGADPKQVGPES
jgi:serine/threonine-protein kinase